MYSKANLKGNTIIANRQSGIYASTSRLTIKENVITDNRRYGVAMYQGSRATSLRDNQFSNGAKEEISPCRRFECTGQNDKGDQDQLVSKLFEPDHRRGHSREQG